MSFDFVVYLLTHTNNTSTYEVEKFFMQIYQKKNLCKLMVKFENNKWVYV